VEVNIHPMITCENIVITRRDDIGEICSAQFNKEDLDEFWENKEDFIKNNLRELSRDKLYSLLLNAAIILKEYEIIQYILDLPHSESILTYIDASNFSPISRTLYSGNEYILRLVKNYVDHYNSYKVHLEGPDFYNLLTILEFSQFEDLDVEKCINEYLNPLYTERSLEQIREILLGDVVEELYPEEINFDDDNCEIPITHDSQDFYSSIYVNNKI